MYAVSSKQPAKWIIFSVAGSINLMWSLAYPLSKIALEELSPMALSVWRMAGAAVLLLPFLRKRDLPKKITAHDAFWLIFLGLVGCGGATFLQFLGATKTNASNLALIVGMETSVTFLLAGLFLGEKIGLRILLSMIVAMLGVFVISVDPSHLSFRGNQDLEGCTWMIAAVFCYAMYTIGGRKLSQSWGPSTLTSIPFVIASVVLIPYFYFTDPVGFWRSLHLNHREMIGVGYIVIFGTAIGYILWNWIIRWLSASMIALSLYVQPIAGAIAAKFILNEALTMKFYLGALLVILGLAIVPHEPESKGEVQ